MHTKNSSEVAKPAILLLIFISTSLLIISLAYFGYKNSKTALAASTIVVNSKADVQLDDGECTLREAIVASNTDTASGALAGECIAGSGDDIINFNIAGAGVRTIVPLSALPPIEAKVDINGYSQPGAAANTAIAPAALNGNLLIEIDGKNVKNYALLFDGDAAGGAGSSVRGLVVNRFIGNTIVVGANNITVAGNYIGTDPTGLIDLGNTGPGITWQYGTTDTYDAKIGGLSPADRNLISGNEDAGSYPSDGWVFQGNYIGVDATGLVAMGNSTAGASGGISADNCKDVTIGGDKPGAINVISGNNSHGVAPDSTQNTTITGNYIGVGADGTTSLPNLAAGIVLTNSTNALIGGSAAGSGNTIANNSLQGIYLGSGNDGVTTEGNTVTSNVGGGIYMQGGTNTTIRGNTVDSNGANGINIYFSASNVTIQGNTANSNSEMGILINSSSYVTIGGSASGEGNSANNNASNGIGLHNSSTFVAVQRNTIENNGSNGIDLYNLVSDSTIEGNFINKNSNNGLQIDNGINIVVGGTAEGSSNTISSNAADGIYIYNFSSNISLEANQITSNGSRGVYINNSSSIDFGTDNANSGNTVENNGSEGVLVSTSISVKLRNSVVTNNADSGITISFSNATAISGGAIESNANVGVLVADSNDVVISNATISQNLSNGALIQASPGAIISGSTITNNNSDGIYFYGSDTGTVKGSSILNNSLNGLVLFNSSSAQIGGVTQADRNIVSGNLGRANVSILGFGGAAENNSIQGNYIGTATNGSYDPSIQQGFGVSVAANSNSNIVGGSSQGTGNIIAGNKGAGVLVNSVTTPEPDSVTLTPVNNAILGNSILSNQSAVVDSIDYPGLGIDLAGTVLDGSFQVASGINVGPTANDIADPDTGSNIYMNFPVLNSAVQNGTKVTMNLSLDAAGTTDAGGLYRVELFANDSADPSGYGEGQTYLGYAMVANGENQEIDFTIPAGINLTGKALSATTTSLNSEITSGFGSSSELSLVTTNIRVIEQPSGLAITGQNLILFILATGSLVLAGLVTLYNSLVKSLPPGGSVASNISLIIARLQAKILQSLQNFYRILGWRKI